jgi:hypothetical protein
VGHPSVRAAAKRNLSAGPEAADALPGKPGGRV